MSNNRTLSTAALVAVFATVVFLVAFALMLVVGGFGIVGSIFMSLVVALAAAIVLALGMGGGSARAMPQPKADTGATAKRAAAPAPASPDPTPASPAPAAAAPEPAPAAEPEAPAEPDAPAGDGRPATLDAPRGGSADNLKEIKGVGPKLEAALNAMGIYHFDQIANWSEAEIAWVDENLEGFKGRVSRDDWVAQARILASGGETEFSKRVEDGDVY